MESIDIVAVLKRGFMEGVKAYKRNPESRFMTFLPFRPYVSGYSKEKNDLRYKYYRRGLLHEISEIDLTASIEDIKEHYYSLLEDLLKRRCVLPGPKSLYIDNPELRLSDDPDPSRKVEIYDDVCFERDTMKTTIFDFFRMGYRDISFHCAQDDSVGGSNRYHVRGSPEKYSSCYQEFANNYVDRVVGGSSF